MYDFSQLLPSLADFGVWGYWIILLAAFAEAFVIIGSFIPGALFVIFSGVLVSKGIYRLEYMIIFASVGAILGDAVSYYIGTYGTNVFKPENRYLKVEHLDKGKAFFEKYGDKSILIGRFFGPLRAVVPFVAGLTRMRLQSFFFWNVVGGVLWATSHVLIGYFFGGSIYYIHKSSFMVTLFLLGLVITLAFMWGLFKQSEIVTRFWKPTVVFLSGFLLYQMGERVFLGESVPLIDMRVHEWFLLVRDDDLSIFFNLITLLGNWQVIVPMAGILSIWLIYRKKRRIYVIPLWVSLVSAEAVTSILKVLVARPRPLGGLLLEHGFSFPSGHATIAMAFFGIISYLMMTHIRSARTQRILVFITVTLVVLIGISRLYLGVHYLSDIFAGYLIGFLSILLGLYVQKRVSLALESR